MRDTVKIVLIYMLTIGWVFGITLFGFLPSALGAVLACFYVFGGAVALCLVNKKIALSE